MNRHRWLSIYLSVLVSMLAAACAPAVPQQPAGGGPALQAAKPAPEAKKPSSYRIAFTLPETGSLATFTGFQKQSAEMAKQEINAAGGVNGVPIEFLYEDSAGDAKTGLSAMQKLATVDQVPVVVTNFTNVALAQVPIADKYGVVLYSPGVSDPRFGDASKWTFRNATRSDDEAKALARYVVKEMKLRTIAGLYINNESGDSGSKAFRAELEAAGGKVLYMEPFTASKTDYRSDLTKIKNLNPQPDGIFLYHQGGPEPAYMMRQMAELGMKLPVTGNQAESSDLIKVAGQAAEGYTYIVGAFDVKSKDPRIATFVEKWRSQYKDDPNVYGANFYDAVKILAQVIKDSGFTAEQIRQGLLDMKPYPGVTGDTAFQKNGDAAKSLAIKTVKDGQFTTVTFYQ